MGEATGDGTERVAASLPGAPDMEGVCVLQVVPALEAGGAERTTLEVARAVVAAGGKSVVVSGGGRLVERLEREGSRHVSLPIGSKSPRLLAKHCGSLARLIRRQRADVVHARSRAPAWPALYAARRTGAAFVTTYHGAYSGRTGAKLLYNSVMARGDAVIANSSFTAEAIRETYAEWRFLEGRRIVTIPRGADLSAFAPSLVDARRRREAKAALGQGGLCVLLPGRLTAWKGQEVMIEAARILARRGRVPGLNVALMGAPQGGTAYRDALAARAEAAGLAGTVHIHGHRDDVAAAYLWADIVVSASTRPEAFGRVAVEAMAMGRPVVATDHGGARETVADGETGLLVPPGDPLALALAVERLSDPGLRLVMGRAGRARARARFTTAAMTAATLRVYHDVLAARGSD